MGALDSGSNGRGGNGVSAVLRTDYQPAAGTAPCPPVWPEPSEHFVLTPQLEELVGRALGYLRAGYPINLAGPAGTGKTTLALHLAAQLRRPVTLIHGDDEFGSSDLVGNDRGYRKSKLVDNFIHSVVKTEETMRTLWMDNRLTTACRYGHVLVYDEFTRSRPEANNVLLSVLGEGLLNLPGRCNGGDGYLSVHPSFRAIFTSNPQEYAGVHKSQDALWDRLITIYMDHYDRRSEAAITAAAGGVSLKMAEQIVDLVHVFRRRDPTGQHPSMRAGIMIAKVLAAEGLACDAGHPLVVNICRDVLHLGHPGNKSGRGAIAPDEFRAMLEKIWAGRTLAKQEEPQEEVLL
ncbi:MAG: gas vesicle protein GvpN [Thermoguttaceae bacterium]|jgi:gas vesicle protein GvpN